MKLTKNLITRDEAFKLCPDYVEYMEGNHDKFDAMLAKFETLRKGQPVVAAIKNYETNQITFVKAKVTSVRSDCIQAIDGPVVRIANDEYSWRCDGAGYAYPI